MKLYSRPLIPAYMLFKLFRSLSLWHFYFKTLQQWTHVLLKRHLLLWTLSNQSMLNVLNEQTNHLLLNEQELNEEPAGLAGHISVTSNLYASCISTHQVTTTSTTLQPNRSTVTFKDNPLRIVLFCCVLRTRQPRCARLALA